MANADFMGLIHTLVHTGEAALGQLNVLTSRMARDGVERNRANAERSLRLLEILAQKTRGNLDADEAEALTGGIQNLREGLRNLEEDVRVVT
jgi:polyhydroxyalkanoate synthesis regulator phasin